MIAISLLSHTEFGLNDHREDANPFSCYTYAVTIFQGNMSDLLFYLTTYLSGVNLSGRTVLRYDYVIAIRMSY